MLERDPRLTILLAEQTWPYRGVEVRGRARVSSEPYHVVALEICRRYVEAYDPNTPVEAYLSPEPGTVLEIEPDVTHCWDYADDAMMPT